jgi:hypothetical protein
MSYYFSNFREEACFLFKMLTLQEIVSLDHIYVVRTIPEVITSYRPARFFLARAVLPALST